MKFQTITELEILENARRSLTVRYMTLADKILDAEEDGGEPSEGIVNEHAVIAEQIDEITDRMDAIKRSARKGGIGDMTRLKVEPKYGDWYYQRIRSYDAEEEREEHVYALYEGDSYMGEFGNITAMKHYARTGQRW